MAMTIDSLAIEVAANANGAYSAIDKLAASLERLRNAVSGGAGLTGFNRRMAELKETVSSISAGTGEKLKFIAEGLKAFQGVKDIKLSSSFAGQIRAISDAVDELDSGMGEKIQLFTDGLKPLSEVGKSNLGSMLNQLKKLPEINEKLKPELISEFAAKIRELSAAMAPLANQMDRVAAGFAAFPKRIQSMITSTQKAAGSSRSLGSRFGALNSKLNALMTFAVARRAGQAIWGWVKNSMDYVEDLNLFAASLGKYTDEAQRFANTASDLLGIDPADWMRSQGVFMTMAEGFGVVSDRAYIMSKNLTQLGYDISSFYNLPVETSMQKLQSGISGELEPLRRLGYDLSQARLKEVALSLGIKQRISTMNQAQQAELRYYAILTQVTTAQGDMARTLEAPSNQMRIFSAAVNQTSRALGNIFIPALNKVLPYVIAFVRLIGWAAQALANLFGFSLPSIDYSGISDAASSAGGLGSALDSANGSAKELKGTLAGFDQLNIIATESGGGGSGSGGGGAGGFDFDLPEYDFLGDLIEGKTTALFEKWKAALEPIMNWVIENLDRIWTIAKGIGLTIAAWKLGEWLGGIGPQLALVVGGLYFEYDALKEGFSNGFSTSTLVQLLASFIAKTAGLTLLFGPTGLVISIATTIVSSIVAFDVVNKEKFQQSAKDIFTSLSNMEAPGLEDFARNLKEITATSLEAARTISSLGDTLQGQKAKVETLSATVGLYTSLLGETGTVTQEEVDKLKGYWAELYEAINASLTATQQIIKTALVDALISATPEVAAQITAIIGEYDRFVQQTQGRLAVIDIEVNRTLDSMVGLEKNSPEYNAAIDNLTKLYTEAGILSSKTSELKWDWENMLESFKSGKINLGTTVEDMKTGLSDITTYTKSYIEEVGSAHKTTLIAIDDEIKRASALGNTTMVEQLQAAKQILINTNASNVAEITRGTISMFDAAQAQVLEGVGAQIEAAKARYAAMSPLEQWMQDTFHGGEYGLVKTAVDEYSKTVIDPLMSALEEQFSILGIEGSGWAADALTAMRTAFVTHGTTEFTPDVLFTMFQNLMLAGQDIIPIAEALGLEIPEAIKSGMLSGSETLPAAVTSFLPGIETALTQMGTSLDATSRQEMYDMINQMVMGISTGQIQLPAGIASLTDTVKLALKTMGIDLQTPAAQAALAAITSIESAFHSNPLDLNATATISLTYVVNTVKTPAVAAALAGASLSTLAKASGSSGASGTSKFFGSINQYATGGYPTSGQLFIANEAGAEMVGTIGGRTAVANNDQIVEGISRGVAAANEEEVALMKEQNNLLRQLLAKEGRIVFPATVESGRTVSRAMNIYNAARGNA